MKTKKKVKEKKKMSNEKKKKKQLRGMAKNKGNHIFIKC